MTPGTVQAELDRMAQTGRVRLSPALANLTPAGHMTARCLEGGRMQLNFDSPMRSPPRSVSAHPCCPLVLLLCIKLCLHLGFLPKLHACINCCSSSLHTQGT